MLNTCVIKFDDKFDIYINSFLAAEGNHLFNEPAYFKLHSHSAKDCYAQLVGRFNNQVFATLAFHESAASEYTSPGRGTFGGVSLNKELQFIALEKFIKTVIDHLRQSGAQVLRIYCAPSNHNNALFAIEFNTLTRQGFRTVEPEVNYSMRIDSRAFMERIDYGNVKRIQKTEREGFVCERIDARLLTAVHRLISENRERQGILVSMSLEQLRNMAELFPDKFHLFAVYRDSSRQEMVAAAVCLALAADILYVLYWGDADGMRSYSPVAKLASEIYSFSVEESFNLIDVGISTLYSEPNYGLVNFKRNLGFTESIKLQMIWQCRLSKEE